MSLQAQDSQFKGVYFTTGGVFQGPDNYVELGRMDANHQVSIVDSVLGDFSNSVILDQNFAYAHFGRAFGNASGEDLVIKYDLLSNEAVDTLSNIAGLQQMAIYGEYLIVSRGFGAADEFVRIYDKNNLAAGPLYGDTTGVSSATGIAVVDTIAYVAYNTDLPYLSSISLKGNSPEWLENIVLDSTAFKLGTLYAVDGMIYGLSEWVDFPAPDFNPVLLNSSVTVFEPTSQGTESFTTPRSNSAVAFGNGGIYANFGTGIDFFNLDSLNVQNISDISFTAGTHDDIDQSFYVQQTDFFSFGRIIHMDENGVPIDSAETDISGSSIAVARNILPSANPDTFLVDAPLGQPYFLDVLANDSDDGPLQLEMLDDNRLQVFEENDSIFVRPLDDTPFSFEYVIIDAWGDRDTATVYLNFGTDVSREDEILASRIQAFPNPATDFLSISYNHQEPLLVQLFDMQGKLLIAKRFQRELHLDLSDLTPGLYVLEFRSQSANTHKKIMVK